MGGPEEERTDPDGTGAGQKQAQVPEPHHHSGPEQAQEQERPPEERPMQRSDRVAHRHAAAQFGEGNSDGQPACKEGIGHAQQDKQLSAVDGGHDAQVFHSKQTGPMDSATDSGVVGHVEQLGQAALLLRETPRPRGTRLESCRSPHGRGG